ncbi:ACT domain-containing protein [Kitasatospora sp. NPDC093550]|uniref:ACT domain-containing protein n=1 Tax=Kitasatospora sp. NPDC093550 TaxID=3364089 RepID=UPI0038088CC0
MSGETDLHALLRGMRPELHSGAYVFSTVADHVVPAGVVPVVTAVEDEGLTIVARQEEADRSGLAYDYVAGWITLRIHSSLAAVGLTAAVSRALADAGISCNVVAAFHHDHLFVPYENAERAVEVLEQLTRPA